MSDKSRAHFNPWPSAVIAATPVVLTAAAFAAMRVFKDKSMFYLLSEYRIIWNELNQYQNWRPIQAAFLLSSANVGVALGALHLAFAASEAPPPVLQRLACTLRASYNAWKQRRETATHEERQAARTAGSVAVFLAAAGYVAARRPTPQDVPVILSVAGLTAVLAPLAFV